MEFPNGCSASSSGTAACSNLGDGVSESTGGICAQPNPELKVRYSGLEGNEEQGEMEMLEVVFLQNLPQAQSHLPASLAS